MSELCLVKDKNGPVMYSVGFDLHAFLFVQDEGIHMFSIGVGLTNLDEIYAIASEPHRQNTILVDSFEELASVSSRLVSAICEGKVHVGRTWALPLTTKNLQLVRFWVFFQFCTYKHERRDFSLQLFVCLKCIRFRWELDSFAMFGESRVVSSSIVCK